MSMPVDLPTTSADVRPTRSTLVARVAGLADPVLTASHFALRVGLALVIGWIGVMKFYGFEATAIEPLVRNSPLMGWMYHLLSVRAFSGCLGAVEITTALLLVSKPLSPKLSVLGGLMAVPMFLTTLTFLVTTPGVWDPAIGGFPFVGTLAGFLMKDVVLLAAALWALGDSLRAAGLPR